MIRLAKVTVAVPPCCKPITVTLQYKSFCVRLSSPSASPRAPFCLLSSSSSPPSTLFWYRVSRGLSLVPRLQVVVAVITPSPSPWLSPSHYLRPVQDVITQRNVNGLSLLPEESPFVPRGARLDERHSLISMTSFLMPPTCEIRVKAGQD
jgi:hypothetical protein